MNWTALVLAGERPDGDPLAAHFGVAAKALLPLAGEPMLGRVVRSLLAVPQVAEVVVLAQQPQRLRTSATAWLEAEPRVRFVAGTNGISASIAAVAGAAARWPVLVTTADHALLTPAMVTQFLAGVGHADLAVGAVERTTVLRAYPATRRTWLRFADGAYSGANLFALAGPQVMPALALWSSVEADRKQAWRLFRRFGPWLALRALTRTIGFGAAVTRAGRNLGLDARVVVLDDAEAAIDVDKPADAALVETILAARARHEPPAACRADEQPHGRG